MPNFTPETRGAGRREGTDDGRTLEAINFTMPSPDIETNSNWSIQGVEYDALRDGLDVESALHESHDLDAVDWDAFSAVMAFHHSNEPFRLSGIEENTVRAVAEALHPFVDSSQVTPDREIDQELFDWLMSRMGPNRQAGITDDVVHDSTMRAILSALIVPLQHVHTDALDVDERSVPSIPAPTEVVASRTREFITQIPVLEGEACFCGEEYHSEHQPIRLPCGHSFGRSCLLKWVNTLMANLDKCPMCRQPYVDATSIP